MQVNIGALPGSYKTGEKYSQVLAWNHYGTKTIPPRPVLRIAAERIIEKDKSKGDKGRIRTYLDQLLKQPPSQHKRLETVLLTSLGRQMAAEAKRIIEE